MTAKIIPFGQVAWRPGIRRKQGAKAKQQRTSALRDEARQCLYQAAAILCELGCEDERISWLIEDCADFLLSDDRQRNKEFGAALSLASLP